MIKSLINALCLGLATFGVAYAQTFTLSSPDFKDNGELRQKHVYRGFGCEGDNLSPALQWSNPPVGTKSLALLVHDPDAPTGGSGWWHWVVINLPHDSRALALGSGHASGAGLPNGAVQVKTDFGVPGWGGPCPPVGAAPHRYQFTLHALKVSKLDLPEGATAALTGFLINSQSIGKATLTGIYGRAR